MSNVGPYVYKNNSVIRDHLPYQSRFGPWFYRARVDGLDDYQFWAATSFFAMITVAALLLSFGQISSIYNRKGRRCNYVLKMVLRGLGILSLLFIAWTIFAGIYSNRWTVASVSGDFIYRAGTSDHMHGTLGLRMGLTGFNVSFVGDPEEQYNQTVYWNERYTWNQRVGEVGAWNHGRFGFGPFSNLMGQQFRNGQFRGTPFPILEVLEYFTLDGENLRWNRWYLNGSYYCYVFLWLSVPFYIITIITGLLKPETGALWLSLTGVSMWFAATLYSGLINKAEPDLAIPFGHDQVLRPERGASYFLVLIVGIITNVVGVCLFYLLQTDMLKVDNILYNKPSMYKSPSHAFTGGDPNERIEPKPADVVVGDGSPVASVAGASEGGDSFFFGGPSSTAGGDYVRPSGTTRRTSTRTKPAAYELSRLAPLPLSPTDNAAGTKPRRAVLRTRTSRRNQVRFGQVIGESFQHALPHVPESITEEDEEYEGDIINVDTVLPGSGRATSPVNVSAAQADEFAPDRRVLDFSSADEPHLSMTRV
eukprot:m.149007 g.149007  ORF g.149007 m.149007 type:complete len:535 (-) comp14201_c0_seq1:161-1765(-)